MAVDVIFAGYSFFSIPSLTQLPFYALRFRINLAYPVGLSLTMRPEILALSGISSSSNGPAAYPAFNHSQIESLTLSPNSKAEAAFVDLVGSRNFPVQPIRAPYFRSE